MTTTNKAFIDAYSGTAGARTVSPIRSDAAAAVFFGTSEFVSAAAPATIANRDEQLSEPASATQSATHRAERRPGAARRPLSQVRAEELFDLHESATETCEPTWPPKCQQLLARAADRYDAVLRKLPGGSTGTLIGVVGAAARSGCTTTAICLALRSSALGFTTALVDGNLAHGGLAAALDMQHFTSWGKLLGTSASIASAVHPVEAVGVDLLLTNPLAAQSLEATARFRASLAAGVLRRKYERIVIDLGTPGPGEADLVADLTAAMGIDYLIAAATPQTSANDLLAARAALSEFGLNLAGVIEAV